MRVAADYDRLAERARARADLRTGGNKMVKRRKSKTTKVVKSAKRTLRRTGAGVKRVAKKAARATGLA
jgi:hypothetical protein